MAAKKSTTLQQDEYSQVAQWLKQERLHKKITKQKIAKSLQLPVATITQLESIKGRDLPKSNILGLYKRYAALLGVESSDLHNRLRETPPATQRQHFFTQPKHAKVKPNYIVTRTVVFSLVGFILTIVAGYGIWQLFILVHAPSIVLDYPPNNSTVTEAEMRLYGSVDSDATVLINGEPAPVNEDGTFVVTLYLQPGYNRISATAVNNFSREKTLQRTVFFDTD